MSDFYRNKNSSFKAFFRSKGIFICVALLFTLVVGIAYFRLNSSSVNTADAENIEEKYEAIQTEPVAKPETNITEPVTSTTEEEIAETSSYIKPVETEVVQSYFGSVPVFSESMNDWRLHQGIDYEGTELTSVVAVADGIVDDVYYDGTMGQTVIVSHADGRKTLYQSLKEDVSVIKGQTVEKGDILGYAGESAVSESGLGVHLHFAVVENGVYRDPDTLYK